MPLLTGRMWWTARSDTATGSMGYSLDPIITGETPRWGKVFALNLYRPNHQHFFNVRLDISVNGPENVGYEVDLICEPDPVLNPRHNAWITQDTLVSSEAGNSCAAASTTALPHWKTTSVT